MKRAGRWIAALVVANEIRGLCVVAAILFTPGAKPMSTDPLALFGVACGLLVVGVLLPHVWRLWRG